MIKKIITAIFFLSFFSTLGQNIILSGNVKDSFQTPLSYANVIAKPKVVYENLQFAITD